MWRIAMTSPKTGSSMTMGRFLIAPVARIATCGWFMMGVPMIEPSEPMLVTVNVPPWISSG
jgi:hypothetical protein